MENYKQYWEVFHLDEYNKKDLIKWLNQDKLVGLVDEKEGGIIGYIHTEHIDKILIKLNKQ